MYGTVSDWGPAKHRTRDDFVPVDPEQSPETRRGVRLSDEPGFQPEDN